MAGLWHLSQQQILDSQGKPIGGAKAYFYEADTLIPLDTYADYSLGVPNPNPLIADAYGRFPIAFLDEADGFFRHRITTGGGVVIVDLATMPIIGPTVGEGGGAEVPVDPDSLLKTGDVKWRLGTGTHTGFVRVNGRTIGSATSGASERANADTQPLFELLWTNFSNSICPVNGGRGGSASADFAANKTIGLPDARGRTLAGLDDMGNSAASRITSLTASPDGITLGSSGGAQVKTIAKANLPASGLTFSGNTGTESVSHTHKAGEPHNINTSSGSDAYLRAGLNVQNTDNPSAQHTHPFSGTTENMGSGTALDTTQPFFLATLYVKL